MQTRDRELRELKEAWFDAMDESDLWFAKGDYVRRQQAQKDAAALAREYTELEKSRLSCSSNLTAKSAGEGKNRGESR